MSTGGLCSARSRWKSKLFCRVSGPWSTRMVVPSCRPLLAVTASGASRMALSVWSGGLRRDEFFALWSFRRSQAGEVGRGVDVKLAPRQGDSVDGFGVPGQDGSSAAVATQLAPLREVGGG